MRKILSAALLLLSVTAFSKTKQQKVSPFLRAGLGYALPISGNYYRMHEDYFLPISGGEIYDGTYSIVNDKKASYGSGLKLNIGGGVMINPYIGIDLGVNMGLLMNHYEFKYASTSGSAWYATYTSHAKLPILILPSVVMSTGDKPTSVYARIGLVLPAYARVVTDVSYSNGVRTKFELKNRISVGFQGALGVKTKIGKHIYLCSEVNAMSLQLKPKSGEYKEYTDGRDLLPYLTTAEKQYSYSSNFTESNKTSSPAVALDMPTPFSNAGLSLGFLFTL